MHPAPHRALFIGLATGITAGGALADPRLERLDVVELIPEVIDAARAFAAWNNHVLTDARAHLHVGDARFWLRGATLNRDDSLRLELDAPKRDRRSITLTGDRLVSIYRRVWLSLARTQLTYSPAPTEPPWDPDYGLRQQMGAAGEDGTPPD